MRCGVFIVCFQVNSVQADKRSYWNRSKRRTGKSGQTAAQDIPSLPDHV